MPEKTGAFLKAAQILKRLEINISRVSYNKVIDSTMLFIEASGGEENLKKAEEIAYKKGYIDKETADRSKLIMEELNLKESDRTVVMSARQYSSKKKIEENKTDIYAAVSIQLEDGTIINGKESEIMDAPAAVILNSIKHLANISDDIHLISPVILEPIQNLKLNTLGIKNTRLNCEEILIALSICAATNPTVQVALSKLQSLKGCQAHSTTIISNSDDQTFRRLEIDITCDPEYQSKNLYYNNTWRSISAYIIPSPRIIFNSNFTKYK